jgi:deoxycytidine triphosphate deaminase
MIENPITCFDSLPSTVFSCPEIAMSRILSDREIKKLIGSVIQGADEKLLNPNGIELRLGDRIKFITTGEEKEIPAGHYVKVTPGECVIIVSLEKLDFSKKTVQKHFPGCMLMAFITPTTTMIREGIMQAATKVDAGFAGNLNWGFRNSSVKDFKIQNGESLFKLTFFLLEGNEVPDVNYGDKAEHKYHNTEGILSSHRRLTAIKRKRKIGEPDMTAATTCHAERTNLSVRTFTRRFTRCTLGYSKKLDNMKHAVALFVWHFNFCRVHSAHGRTPAQEAGLTSKAWTIGEMLSEAN